MSKVEVVVLCQDGRMRVLVVEDETGLAETLKAGLTAEGYAVDLAFDGADGLWLASRYRYAAVVLDIMLPGLNGYQVCQRLRATDNDTPILVLTSKDGEYDQIEALDTGADDFLVKPFSYQVLLARLRALVRRGGSSSPSVLRLDDLSLDLGTRRCRRGEVDIPLTPKETAILAYLLERAGEVVSKADLVANLWDFAAEVDPNLVEVHISALRGKIDAPFGRRTIKTIRGAGYQLTGQR
ncbi:DNA-binding response regulator, OmpR family, contains REC and winged-helix (wHTH) domain [Kibdelosporangium aridum]|uniref:DNA-binding response regulator, OmpR family, contains REC and winged-helix (WHTH) domain n=2 Tax=Kibdelosporangium aridum TaxID=2030 RepID=A0A1Y5Y7X0_KIBAR|nr:DNA-binding response regulator, OmpR family, contains REC and winged-helix (wHTH) domain [Kibdelosporangium aridum]